MSTSLQNYNLIRSAVNKIKNYTRHTCPNRVAKKNHEKHLSLKSEKYLKFLRQIFDRNEIQTQDSRSFLVSLTTRLNLCYL